MRLSANSVSAHRIVVALELIHLVVCCTILVAEVVLLVGHRVESHGWMKLRRGRPQRRCNCRRLPRSALVSVLGVTSFLKSFGTSKWQEILLSGAQAFLGTS
ncbi:hypothetical protein MRX96_058025 [Rhipicephalus microplus]